MTIPIPRPSSNASPLPLGLYLNTWLSPERHTISLLLCITLTLLCHPHIILCIIGDCAPRPVRLCHLLAVLCYWAAYLLWLSLPLLLWRLPTIYITTLLRPSSLNNPRIRIPIRTGSGSDRASPFPSPCWATLHLLLLRREVPRGVWVLRTAVVSYAVFFLMLAWLPRAVGEELLGWAIPALAAMGSYYLRFALTALAVQFYLWTMHGVRGVLLPVMESLLLLTAEALYFAGDVLRHAAGFLSS